MAQLISDGRNGFQSARDDALASIQANVQATFLSSGDGNDLPSSHVIGFSQHTLLNSHHLKYYSYCKLSAGCISDLGIHLTTGNGRYRKVMCSKVNELVNH